MSNEEKQRLIYILSEKEYRAMHPDISDEYLFPLNWYSISDYYIMSKILVEALQKNITIKETSRYKELNNNVRIK